MSKRDAIECDIAIAGGGLGGVSAALVAAERGASVAVVEAGERLGGTSVYSGGSVHNYGVKSFEEYRKICPTVDPILGATLISRFDEYVKWLLGSGAPGAFDDKTRGLRPVKKQFSYHMGHTTLPRGRLSFYRYMHQKIESLGGRVFLRTRAIRLARSKEGRVEGLMARSGALDFLISAKVVVLATGGFQASKDLLAKYVGPAGSEFVRRAVEYDQGDGLQMGLEAGAAMSQSMDTIYGHLMPAPPCSIGWSDLVQPALLSAFYAEQGIVVNVRGERFVDEGVGEGNGETINAAAKQPAGGLWIVLDENLRSRFTKYQLPPDTWSLRNAKFFRYLKYITAEKREDGTYRMFDSLKAAVGQGAVVLSAETLQGLGERLAEHGVDKDGFGRTVAEFNGAVKEGVATGIAIPKRREAHKLERAPFLAIKVAVGVSMTYGGLRINEKTEVLDERGKPIAGLYAVPGAAGGIMNLYYGGANVLCGVFGMIAGQETSGLVGASKAEAG